MSYEASTPASAELQLCPPSPEQVPGSLLVTVLAGCLSLLGMVSLTVPALRLNEVLRANQTPIATDLPQLSAVGQGKQLPIETPVTIRAARILAVEPIETKFASETSPFRYWRPVEIGEGKQPSNDLVLVGYCQDEQFQQAVAQLRDSGELTGRLVAIPKLDSSVGIVRPKWLGRKQILGALDLNPPPSALPLYFSALAGFVMGAIGLGILFSHNEALVPRLPQPFLPLTLMGNFGKPFRRDRLEPTALAVHAAFAGVCLLLGIVLMVPAFRIESVSGHGAEDVFNPAPIFLGGILTWLSCGIFTALLIAIVRGDRAAQDRQTAIQQILLLPHDEPGQVTVTSPPRSPNQIITIAAPALMLIMLAGLLGYLPMRTAVLATGFGVGLLFCMAGRSLSYIERNILPQPLTDVPLPLRRIQLKYAGELAAADAVEVGAFQVKGGLYSQIHNITYLLQDGTTLLELCQVGCAQAIELTTLLNSGALVTTVNVASPLTPTTRVGSTGVWTALATEQMDLLISLHLEMVASVAAANDSTPEVISAEDVPHLMNYAYRAQHHLTFEWGESRQLVPPCRYGRYLYPLGRVGNRRTAGSDNRHMSSSSFGDAAS